jgi:hypothetical protein
MTPEEFIRDCTRGCSNELCSVEDRYGKEVRSYHEWLTPEQALRAVEMAREEVKEIISFTVDYCQRRGTSVTTQEVYDEYTKDLEECEIKED